MLYSKPYQTLKVELFMKIYFFFVKKPSTIFAESFILDV